MMACHMALVAVSGHPGCRYEEVARIAAQRLQFEYFTQSRLHRLGAEEFGPDTQIPPKAWPALATSILARLATEHHIVYCASGGELQARHFPGLLRAHVVAPENVRIGNLMLDHRLERAAARQLLLDLEAADRADRKAKFGKTKATADLFDLVLNAEALNSEQMAELIANAATSMGLDERGFLSTAAEAQLQFQMRFRLARYGLTPPGKATLRKKIFAHHSEEMFANLLDFYRIAWEYEPRSFPIHTGPERRSAGGLHARFLFARVRSLCRADYDEAIAGDEKEPQGPPVARTVSRSEYPGVLLRRISRI